MPKAGPRGHADGRHGAGGLFPDDPFVKALAKHYRVYAPLLPGYGDSEGADRLRDMLDVTLHCYDVIDALKLTKPLVMGHSMGGMIAAEMAAVAPNEIERMALICPAGLWLDATPIPDIFAMVPSEFPPLLFHDTAFGVKLMTAGQDMNNPADMERIVGWGVDGLITDYPDRLREVLSRQGIALPPQVK